jgi:hypothetical protein
LLTRLFQVAVGCGLLGLVVFMSFGAYLAETSPALALKLDPHHPVALRRLAEQILADLQSAEEPKDGPSRGTDATPQRIRFAAPTALLPKAEESPQPNPSGQVAGTTSDVREASLNRARQLVEAAIKSDPLDYRALTLLGMIAQMQAPPGQGTDAARPYFEMAARLSPRASEAIYWLLQRNVEARNYAAAITQADTLLRTVSRAGPAVIPILARLAEEPEATEQVTALLRGNPPWRGQFFAGATNHITDARTPLTMLLALRDAAHPPSDAEVRGYLNFLVARHFYDLAYYTWLQFLPPDRLASTGLLFNGSFETKPSGFPFDWTVTAGAGATVEFPPLPDEPSGRGLRVDFSQGRIQFGGVAQAVLLPEGRYVLHGRFRGELEGRRGLRWRVVCLDRTARRMIAETPMHLGPISGWQEFELDFAVPATACAMQQVRLDFDARSSSEQLVRGTLWYSNMTIRRQEAAATAGPQDAARSPTVVLPARQARPP